MRQVSRPSPVVLALWGACALIGCNSILGIQERHLSGDVGDAGATSSSGGGPSSACLPDATDIRTGVIQVDGLLDAADTMIAEFERVETDFHSRIEVMAGALSLDTSGGYSSELVDDVIAALSEDSVAYSHYGVAVFIDEVECRVDVEMALEQQRRCEAEAGCDTSVESTEVECAGLCLGDCAGPCDLCRTPSSTTCDESCLGTCQLEAAADCEGLCEGTCSGSCTAYSGSDCAGDCDGICQGSCELFVQESCSGLCEGSCTTSSSTACPATAACIGHCEGICTGDCIGRPVPIPGDPACESADHCATLASLLGAASVICDPPGVTAAFDVGEDVSAGDAAQFRARTNGVIASSPQLLAGLAVLEIIAAGQLVGVPIETTPPYQLLTSELSNIAVRAERGQQVLGVAEDCEAEVLPFVDPVVAELTALTPRGTALVGDQLKFLFALQAGFH